MYMSFKRTHSIQRLYFQKGADGFRKSPVRCAQWVTYCLELQEKIYSKLVYPSISHGQIHPDDAQIQKESHSKI